MTRDIARPQLSKSLASHIAAKADRTKRLADEFASLQQKANEGDATSASELYRKLNACSRAQLTQWQDMNNYTRNVAAASDPSNDLDGAQALNREAQLYADKITFTEQLCDGTTKDMLKDLATATLQAAKLGDHDARACYIHRGPFVSPTAALDDPSLLANYRNDAETLIAEGMNDGDWKVVAMLMFASSASGNQMLSGVTGFDPELSYRMHKLWSLGLSTAQQTSYNAILANERMGLSDDDVARADAAATSTFERAFKNSGNGSVQVFGAWDACGTPAEPTGE